MTQHPRSGRHCGTLLLSTLLLFGGCGGQDGADQIVQKMPAKQESPPLSKTHAPEPGPAAPPPTEPASSPQPEARGSGTIVGRILFDAEAPQRQPLTVSKDTAVCGQTEKFSESLLVGPDKGIKNAVVFLRDVAGGKQFPTSQSQSDHPTIDQTGCIYDPHVLLVQAGATIDIKNSDGILHNIHTYSEQNPAFNMAQPKFQKVISKTFDQPEIIRVTCDVHAWMTAWLVVQDHPYYALTDETGAFQLTDVPSGEYALKVWHEELGEQTTTLTVTAGQEAPVEPVEIVLSRAG